MSALEWPRSSGTAWCSAAVLEQHVCNKPAQAVEGALGSVDLGRHACAWRRGACGSQRRRPACMAHNTAKRILKVVHSAGQLNVAWSGRRQLSGRRSGGGTSM